MLGKLELNSEFIQRDGCKFVQGKILHEKAAWERTDKNNKLQAKSKQNRILLPPYPKRNWWKKINYFISEKKDYKIWNIK